ncbi:MAG: peptidylprolyl isomerase [Planctomycetes bacterium]|nr:peptidylprolyl isomerase [Planctomycetota bacterium]
MLGFGKKKDAGELAGITAVIETSLGSMTLSFFPDKAPGHVDNFVTLAEKGFYDGTVFHRTIPGFMIQGGCPEGTGTGGPGYKVKAEFNDTPHVRGILSAARSQDPDSAGSQFFICHGDARFLDKQYTAFGKLTAGDDVLEKIATAPAVSARGEKSKPVNPVKITKVRVVRPAATDKKA